MLPFNDFITPERVRELFDYSPDTGEIFWTASGHWRLVGRRAGFIKNGYRRVIIGGVEYAAHRLIWLHVHGCWPSVIIDHVNGIKSDNRLINLREATYQQNRHNSKALAASGLKGVYKRRNAWSAEIRAANRTIRLGTFPTKEEAASVYAEAARRRRGEFARLA